MKTIHQAHQVPVTALTFSQDGFYLISGGEDGVIKFWGVP